MEYIDFLKQKIDVADSCGFDVDRNALNPKLYDFQKDIVRWALKKGRAAIFADCGLGKTAMQLEFARHACARTGKPVLILAPLAVAAQTYREGQKFGVDVNICEDQNDVCNGINITNYEKMSRFTANAFGGIVLDESSILKSYSGKTRTELINNFSNVPYRLACTATPAPNDFMEMGNHAEFLGVMTRAEMLATYFIHDGGCTSKWRLKGHAEDAFWRWLGSWSVFVSNPSDLGYDISGFDLPDLRIDECVVDSGSERSCQMSLVDDTPEADDLTLSERREARRESLGERCKKAAELVNGSDEQWLVWCDLNAESERLTRLITGSVEVKGSDNDMHKVDSMIGFASGDIKCLVTKPSIAGFGMNWQNCRNMIFVGLSDSYEAFYQAVRRCWRFGQERNVNVYIITSSREGCVKQNISRKHAESERMKAAMRDLTRDITKNELRQTSRNSTPYNARADMRLPDWREFNADIKSGRK